MVASEDITLVIIHAPGFSGATWVNTVLGCHPLAMSMGPCARIATLLAEDADEACYLHRGDCQFWPPFLRRGYRPGTFFETLGEFSGKRVFILNYPPGDFFRREIADKGFCVLYLSVIRDGRANVFSYMRHNRLTTDRDLETAIKNWLLVKWREVAAAMPSDPRRWRRVRYEDLVENFDTEIERLGDFIGLKYSSTALQFWKFEHHPTAGNTGMIDLLCQLQGYPSYNHHREDDYRAFAGDLRADPARPIVDDGWCWEMDRHRQLIFDRLAGVENAAFGYDSGHVEPPRDHDIRDNGVSEPNQGTETRSFFAALMRKIFPPKKG